MPSLSVLRPLTRLPRSRAASRTRQDRAVALRLARRFEHSLQEAQIDGLCFYVRNGCVRVIGRVSNPFDLRILLSIIRNTDGVKEVEHRPGASR